MKSPPSILAAMLALCFMTGALSGPFIATPARADERKSQPGESIEAALLAELKALDEKLEKVKDLKSKITQTKHVALLKDPLISQGSALVMGEQMRWDITKPALSTTLTSAAEIRIHYPQQKIVEVYAVDQRMASVIASPLPRLATLLKHFHIERHALPKDADATKLISLRLTPLHDDLKKHLEHVDVIIERASAVTSRMDMVDVDGDRTTIDFHSIELNTGLKPGDFDLTLPPGTRIVRPLETKGKDSP